MFWLGFAVGVAAAITAIAIAFVVWDEFAQ